MTLYAVRLHDKPEALPIRQRELPAHIEWLDRHRDVVLVGGSLRPEPGAPPVGGLWIVEAPDKKSVEDLLRTDPFYVQGLRERWEIFHWSKAFPDRKVPV